MALTREQIYAMRRRTKVVRVPQWPDPQTGAPGEVHVVEPDAVLRQRLQVYFVLIQARDAEALKDFGELFVDVAMACCQTPDGAPLFVEENRAWLKATSGTALAQIFDAVYELSLLGPAALEAAKANFPEAPPSSASS